MLLAVFWRTRATGRLYEVLGFVVYICWPCPLSSWFLRNFGFLSSSWSLQVYSRLSSSFLVGNYVLQSDMLLGLYLLSASVFAHCGGDVGIFVVYSHVILRLELFVGDLWFLSPYSRSESAHPRLMESDDVVCLACLVVQASLFLCMSELDRAGASLNAISLSPP